MGHVVDLVQPQLKGVPGEDVGEHLANPVQDHLPVHEGHVDGAVHGLEVVLAFRRGEGSTGQLPIPHRDAVFGLHDFEEQRKVIRGDLVTEPPAAAVVHDQYLVRDADAQSFGQRLVEDVLFPGHLDLQVVVPGAEGSDLVDAALHRPLAHPGGVGPGHAAALLGPLEVLGQRVAALQAPAHALLAQGPELAGSQLDEALAADSRRDGGEQPVDQLGESRLDFLPGQRSRHQAHAAVDVEADPAGGNDAVGGVEGRHPSDREAVAAVPVGHAQGVTHDSGQGGHVGGLFEHGFVHPLQERTGAVEAGGHEHPGLVGAGKLPEGVGDSAKRFRYHQFSGPWALAGSSPRGHPLNAKVTSGGAKNQGTAQQSTAVGKSVAEPLEGQSGPAGAGWPRRLEQPGASGL